MLYKYRLERITKKIAAQKKYNEVLSIAEKEFGRAYYTDRYLKASMHLFELQAIEAVLKNKLEGKEPWHHDD